MAPGIKPYESLHPSTPVQTDGSIRKVSTVWACTDIMCSGSVI